MVLIFKDCGILLMAVTCLSAVSVTFCFCKSFARVVIRTEHNIQHEGIYAYLDIFSIIPYYLLTKALGTDVSPELYTMSFSCFS